MRNYRYILYISRITALLNCLLQKGIINLISIIIDELATNYGEIFNAVIKDAEINQSREKALIRSALIRIL